MDLYLLDWANLLLRWVHVITAIAWIGSSFYFVFLDASLEPPADPALRERGVTGELWAVHGGGFYNPQKYAVGPKQLPKNHLHWFYWESYATWLSGFGLFTLLYLWQARAFLVDPSRMDWSPMAAGFAALAFLVVGWLVYDVICHVFGREKDGSVGGDLRVGLLVGVFVVAATWLACQLFAGRAAFLLIGAMLATNMSANVAHWIIPGQRKVVRALQAGEAPNPVYGQRGKQRSVHNTYFTLPVLVAMLSNHYGWLTSGPHNWLVLVLLMLAGVLVRHFFVARHKAKLEGRAWPWAWFIAGSAIVVALVVWLAPAPRAVSASLPASPGYAQVEPVIAQRCVLCHNAQVQNKNVALHTPELLRQQAALVYQQVVLQRTMPLNNATQMTEDERELLRRWFDAGAKTP